ncbi:hypothetical protein [Rhodanobacter lindaniclasticus]
MLRVVTEEVERRHHRIHTRRIGLNHQKIEVLHLSLRTAPLADPTSGIAIFRHRQRFVAGLMNGLQQGGQLLARWRRQNDADRQPIA